MPRRASYKQPYDRDRQRICPRCAQPLIHVGSTRAAAAGPVTTPPRTLSEVRERMTYARRSGEPFARALVRHLRTGRPLKPGSRPAWWPYPNES
ncbi:hypothetical protein [Streptomyces massasporeus]|uniref:hypothetical protein n=1 Tax=Streptomyces massasporeus TaxID=67324 RepID=UPI0036D0E48C